MSVFFLFLFSVAMLDFARGYRSRQGSLRGARHVAWAEGRSQEDAGHGGPPNSTTVKDRHLSGVAGTVTVLKGQVTENSPFAAAFSAIPGGVTLGRGVIPFLSGGVDMDWGAVGQQVGGIRLMPSNATGARHYVSLRSRREEDPADPEGWWDPFKDMWDKILP